MLLEWLLALMLLILTAPLMAGIALVILAADGRPVFYREPRVGRDGQRFSLIKFRTLRSEAGPAVAPVGDARIFPPAQVLRRWRLDELPQFLHVLRGDMALVGPRPLPVQQANTLPPETRARLFSVRPGITGASALAFLGDDAALAVVDNAEQRYLSEVLPVKVALDIEYIEHWSLRADFALLLKTVYQIASRSAREASSDRVTRLLAARVPGPGHGRRAFPPG